MFSSRYNIFIDNNVIKWLHYIAVQSQIGKEFPWPLLKINFNIAKWYAQGLYVIIIAIPVLLPAEKFQWKM